MFTLLVLTPVFKNMPNNAQAAIIISAVIGLFNYTEWLFLWRVSPFLSCQKGIPFSVDQMHAALEIAQAMLVPLDSRLLLCSKQWHVA